MKRTRLYLPWSLLAGLLAMTVAVEGLKATALVLGKLKAKTTTEAPPAADSDGGDLDADSEDNSTRSLLTGIPQQDYIHDPNLPRELNGYNLTEYPFYDRVPDEMDFKCDGLHDGFYASVAHKCQVYHHCLHGTRYDFLCANYTAFDQKTFICHFVSEVDCVNSPKYFKRNEALYKATTTTSTTPKPTQPTTQPPAPARRPQSTEGRRQRPFRRRRPVYDYYYDDEYEDQLDEYEDDVLPPSGKGGGRRTRKHPRRPAVSDEPERRPPSRAEDPERPVEDTSSDLKPRPSSSVYDRPRVPPKIRRPVPLNERDKYEYGSTRSTLAPPAAESADDVKASRSKPSRPAQTTDDDYYDDDYDTPPARTRPGKNNQDYYPTAGGDIARRPPMSGAGRPIRRRPAAGGRRRPSVVDTATPYSVEEEDDYEFEDEQPRRPRPSGRKRQRQPAWQDDYQRPQSSRHDQGEYNPSQRPYTSSKRGGGRYEDDEEPVPAPRPSYISSAPSGRQGYRKRPQPDPVDEYSSSPRSQQGSSSSSGATGYKRPSVSRKQVPSRYADESDDDYYEDDIEEEPTYRRPRPSSRGTYKQEDEPPPSRPQSTNKRPYTPTSRAGSASSPRGSPTQSRSDVPEDRPGRGASQQSTSNFRPKSEADTATPRSSTGYRAKVSPVEEESEEEDFPTRPATGYRKPMTSADDRPQTSGSYRRPTIDDEAPKAAFNYRKSSTNDEDRPQISGTYRKSSTAEEERPQSNGNVRKPYTSDDDRSTGSYRKSWTSVDDRPQSSGNYRKTADESRSSITDEEPDDDVPVRVPPSAYGNFRTKLTPSERESASRASPPKYRASGQDPEPVLSSTSRPKPETQSERTPPPPTAAAKDISLEPSAPSGPGRTNFRTPAKVIIKPVTVRIPENIPDQQNLADIPDHDEYDVTLNDALHPTLHPTRSIPSGFVLPQRQDDIQGPQNIQKNKGYQPPRGAFSYNEPDLPTTAPGRVPSGYLEGSASQRYITRTTFPVHVKEDSSTDATYRARRPAPQYEEVSVNPGRYRQPDDGNYSYQSRPNWNTHPRVVRTYYSY